MSGPEKMESPMVNGIMQRLVSNASKQPHDHSHENGNVNGHVVANGSPSVNGVNESPFNGVENSDQIQEEPDLVEPVAIIGLSLKFPEDARSPDSFWEMLINGRSAMTEVPSDRFNIDSFYTANRGKTATLNVRGGHFLKGDLAAFDAPFFSISASEAACIDPQQRWLLEVAYHALENAGVSMEQAIGSKTAVYVGSFMRDYEIMLARDSDMPIKYKSTGTGTSILANRLSWFFDFKGPSVTVDTACSSSLMALHLACQSIRSGESTMAIVAGCNMIFNPEMSIGLSELNFLSPDSRCYSFDSRANGYSRGEGIGVVVLKAIKPAIKNDTIRAVIRNTGANQDGRTPGITQPSAEAQESLIRDTYEKAGLDMSTTRFFEAHGTGTPVGDPLEIKGIYSAFKDSRPHDEPLLVGAVKSNIGHLEGASGIAGLIKTILTLERGIIPQNIGYEHPNPEILLDSWNIDFPLKPTLWPSKGLRRASVSSFGFGGSNAHAILDDAYNYLRMRSLQGRHCTAIFPHLSQSLNNGPSASPNHTNGVSTEPIFSEPSSPRLLVLSASDEGGISRLRDDYKHYFETQTSNKQSSWFDNLTYTLCDRRSLLAWRSFATTTWEDDLSSLAFTPPVRCNKVPRLSFVFTGQGAQWSGMGRELLQYQVFRQSLKDAEVCFKSLGCQWSLIDKISTSDGGPEDLDSPEYSQPVTTALQLALVDLLRSWEVNPKVVIGHSSGEIAAAYCTGISRDLALKIAYYRGLVSSSVKVAGQEPGSMLAVALSQTDVERYLSKPENPVEYEVTIGCINSPNSITLTGSEKGIDEIQRALENDNIHCRKLRVGVAYHSRFMDAAAGVYRSLIESAQSTVPKLSNNPVSMISSITGKEVRLESLADTQYWIDNMVSPVLFSNAASYVFAHASKNTSSSNPSHLAIDYLLEIGPHSTLQGPLRDILKSMGKTEHIQYGSVLVRQKSAVVTALEAAGKLHVLGYPVNLMESNNLTYVHERLDMLTNLPSYPFNHEKKYWAESRVSKAHRFREYPVHELLGTRSADWNPLEARWYNRIIQSESPFVKDHKVNGLEVYPAAGMLCMAIEAARQIIHSPSEASGYRLKDVSFSRALVLNNSPEGTETQIYIRPSQDGNSKMPSWHEFRICTFENGEWQDNCRGAISVEYYDNGADFATKKELEAEVNELCEGYQNGSARCKMAMTSTSMYEIFGRLGLEYGPTFESVSNVRFNDDGEATGNIDLCGWSSKLSGAKIQSHVIHPTALDGVLQTGFPAITRGGKDIVPTIVPTKVRNLWISANYNSEHPETSVDVYTKCRMQGFRTVDTTTIGVRTSDGLPYITGDFEMTFVSGKEMLSSSQGLTDQLLYNLDCKADVDLLNNDHIAKLCSSLEDTPTPLTETMANEKETLCYQIMLKTLNSLDHSQIVSSPHIQKYVDWMRYRVAKPINNYLFDSAPISWTGSVTNDEDLENLYSALENCDAEGELLVRVSRSLMDILRGKVGALEILFRDDVINEYYRTAQDGVLIFTKTMRYIDILGHKNPGLKILEVGAGTGGVTGYIVDTLMHHGEHETGAPRFSDYVYTDVSPSFFEHAKARFNNSRMAFKVLDIEKDPKTQGFEAGTYDLVIAANVLHATADISATLKHARQLLKTGGKLILFEDTNPNLLRTGFTFGVLPGWWLSTEKSRQWGPLLTITQWRQALSDNGFSGADAVLSNYEDLEYQAMNSIISTAVVSGDKSPTPVAQVTIVSTQSSTETPIANRLQVCLGELLGTSPTIISIHDIESSDLTDTSCIFLPELHQPFLHCANEMQLKGVQKITDTARGVLWLTRSENDRSGNPTRAAVTGISRTIMEEVEAFRFVTLELESVSNTTRNVDHILNVFKATLQNQSDACETEYVERNGILCIGRIVEANDVVSSVFPDQKSEEVRIQRLGRSSDRPLKLSIGSVGLLDTLRFVDDPIPAKPLEADEIEIDIKACGLNFRDVIIALGQLPYDTFGNECAGIVRRVGDDAAKLVNVGDRVACGLVGAFNTFTRCKVSSARKIPDDMTFGEAAAMTIVFCTAHYALSHWARLKRGETILIHSGAGGLGQATVQLAQRLGAEVFITVGNEDKKNHMMRVYGIPEDHIFSSRTLAFAKGIKRLTNKRGVDVVINSLAGEGLRASWECIAPFGRFIEVGKKDIYSQKVSAFEGLPMFQFSKNVMFASVDLALLMESDPEMMTKLMADVAMMTEKKEIFVPQPLNTYNCGNIEQAFRLMQSGKHMGKIVIELHEDDLVPVVSKENAPIMFDPNATYLIAGGLGGIGRCIALWMVDHGARYLVLLSRSKIHNEEVTNFLEDLQGKGTVVAIPPCNISDEVALATVLSDCAHSMPPIKGCIQSSMVIQNALFTNMTADKLTAALQPKVKGSWNLHTLLPRNLDFFILLSSYAGLIGSVGQSNYAAGNTYQDALARHRVAHGEKAVSIDLGAVKAAGFLYEHPNLASMLASIGHVGMSITEVLALIEYYCDPSLQILSPLKSQVVTCLELPSTLRAKNLIEFSWMARPRFGQLYQIDSQTDSSANASASRPSDLTVQLETQLQGAESLSDATDMVCEGLRTKLGQVLGIETANITSTEPTHSHGVDSLVAVELRNWFKKAVGADVAVFEILGNGSLAELAAGAAEKSKFVKDAIKKSE